jgi:hypothetical protein
MNGTDERNLLERGDNNIQKPSRRDHHIIIWESQILLWELNLTNEPTKLIVQLGRQQQRAKSSSRTIRVQLGTSHPQPLIVPVEKGKNLQDHISHNFALRRTESEIDSTIE